MRRSSLAVHVALLTVCIVAFAVLVQAQYRTSIQGVVTDTTGAVVPGATLTLINPATNEKQIRTSDSDGVFNFNALAAAPFRLEAEKSGFVKKVIDNVNLTPDQANAISVQLEVGSTSTTVNVDASALPALETETASVTGVVSSNQIQHMPSFGRDVTKLAQLAPGTFADGSQASGSDNYNLPGTQTGGGQSGGNDGIFKTENGVQAIANGNQTENNGISIDGISTVSSVWGGATVITPSEDSVESVEVVSNSYDAEDGRFSGAQVKITSKSGTNNFHGSLFFTTHQPNLNAFQRYNGGNSVQRDNNKFNQFGGSLGGPIWKNKIFAFFNYETVREPNSDLPGTGWYDTAAFDALAPAGSIAAQYLSYPGNGVLNHGLSSNNNCAGAGLTEGVNCVTIPGAGINVGTPLTIGSGKQDLGWTNVTNPGCGGAGTGCGTPGSPFGTIADLANYITSNPTTFTATQYNGRLDADVTSKDRIGFAIYWVPLTKDNYNGSRAYDIFHHNQINDAFSAIWNHTFSPSFLNELRANAAGWRWNEITDNSQSPVGFPTDNIGVTGSITAGSFGPNVGTIFNQWTYSYKDVATKIYGRHTIKFGGEATRLFYLQNNASGGVPSYQFFNIWDFLNDAPHNESSSFDPTTGFPSTVRQDDRENILGFFAQDDLKLRPNLTLNLGLRWSYFGPLYSKQNNMFRSFPGAGSNYFTDFAIREADSWNTQKNNFGPNVGVAWSPTRFNNRLVFRGGYGLSYNGEEFAVSSSIVQNPGLVVNPNFNQPLPTSPYMGLIYALSSGTHDLYGYPANPNAMSTFGPNGIPTTGSVGVQIFPNTLPTMRAHHYSADMQYDLGHQYVMTVGYQGSLGRNLYFHQNPLAVPSTLGYALNPQISGGDNWAVNGHSNFNALLAELKHQFSHQFMIDAQYQYAKSMDTSSAPYSEQDYPYNPSLNYGRSDFNVGNAFKIYGMWQPVFFHGSNDLMEKIVGGWSISGIFNWHSGFPYSPFVPLNNSFYCSNCGYFTGLPAAYLGGAGNSRSNDSFKIGPSGDPEANSNFPKGGPAYFTIPACPPPACTGTSLPPNPGAARNSLTMPGYKDLDLTVAKGFGLPKMPVLGESARLDFRIDIFNVFNNLNFNENQISNNIGNSNFGTIAGALSGRVLSLGARFNF
jgi:hypothetical protein